MWPFFEKLKIGMLHADPDVLSILSIQYEYEVFQLHDPDMLKTCIIRLVKKETQWLAS